MIGISLVYPPPPSSKTDGHVVTLSLLSTSNDTSNHLRYTELSEMGCEIDSKSVPFVINENRFGLQRARNRISGANGIISIPVPLHDLPNFLSKSVRRLFALHCLRSDIVHDLLLPLSSLFWQRVQHGVLFVMSPIVFALCRHRIFIKSISLSAHNHGVIQMFEPKPSFVQFAPMLNAKTHRTPHDRVSHRDEASDHRRFQKLLFEMRNVLSEVRFDVQIRTSENRTTSNDPFSFCDQRSAAQNTWNAFFFDSRKKLTSQCTDVEFIRQSSDDRFAVWIVNDQITCELTDDFGGTAFVLLCDRHDRRPSNLILTQSLHIDEIVTRPKTQFDVFGTLSLPYR